MIGIATLDSPIGPLTLAARGDRVCLLHFGPDGPAIRRSLERWYPGQAIVKDSDPAGAGTVLAAYFAGDIHALDRITVEMNGTPFQKRVWEALRRVRAGTTVPYSAIARTIQARRRFAQSAPRTARIRCRDRAVSPDHRLERDADRLRRGLERKGVAAAARGRAGSSVRLSAIRSIVSRAS